MVILHLYKRVQNIEIYRVYIGKTVNKTKQALV